MKLYNAKITIAGLIVFVALACLPFWYGIASGKTASAPELQLPDPRVHPQCVEPREYMRSSHMVLLNEWRDSVVRDGERDYVSKADGTHYSMSLTKTCLDCHANKQEFCDKCHNYTGVDPYCWNCHVDPHDAEVGR